MLRSVRSLIGYKIGATDDVMGKVDNFLFHDSSWIIRYVVVDTGNWLAGRKVLISPVSVEQPVTEVKILPVNLTREQVKNSPDIDTDKPISRKAEIELYRHCDWTPYCTGGGFAAPVIEPSSEEKKQAAVAAKKKVDSLLRSIQEVIGYQVDMEKIMKAAKERGCFMELNAHPDRLDLDDVNCRMAKELGVKIVLSTDAHSIDGLEYALWCGSGKARLARIG